MAKYVVLLNPTYVTENESEFGGGGVMVTEARAVLSESSDSSFYKKESY
jgi:hypothetical protein